MKLTSGYLIVSISYNKDGEAITLPRGTPVLVDTARSIALVNGEDHIDILSSEWAREV